MARFENAIEWVMNGGKARRACWADVPDYTHATPPMRTQRRWRIWRTDTGAIVQGWGGQVGCMAEGAIIRDGTIYVASDADRTATDWELMQ